LSRGKQPRPPAKVPEWGLSVKGCCAAQTTRRLAQKQPSFKECVIAHWSSGAAPTMDRGSSPPPKLWMQKELRLRLGGRGASPAAAKSSRKGRWSAGECECRHE
jgi:hypothetical protein